MKVFRLLSRRGADGRERGAAIVEFAVTLPLLLTVLFGIMEYGWLFMVRQTLQNAAREGCRMAVLQSSDTPYAEVTQRVAEVMQPSGILTYETQMTHATGADQPSETVTVSVPKEDVSLLGGFFGNTGGTLSGRCTMRKEGIDTAEEE